jgi:hypothetical protein
VLVVNKISFVVQWRRFRVAFLPLSQPSNNELLYGWRKNILSKNCLVKLAMSYYRSLLVESTEGPVGWFPRLGKPSVNYRN